MGNFHKSEVRFDVNVVSEFSETNGRSGILQMLISVPSAAPASVNIEFLCGRVNSLVVTVHADRTIHFFGASIAEIMNFGTLTEGERQSRLEQ